MRATLAVSLYSRFQIIPNFLLLVSCAQTKLSKSLMKIPLSISSNLAVRQETKPKFKKLHVRDIITVITTVVESLNKKHSFNSKNISHHARKLLYTTVRRLNTQNI